MRKKSSGRRAARSKVRGLEQGRGSLDSALAQYRIADGIHVRPSQSDADFPYSDGDEAEIGILNHLKQCEDRSMFSQEVIAGIHDWPTTYHLSAKRANLLRPFSKLLRSDVLEVGAGCGALTRYLGENGGSIVGLEPSRRRATIARARTADLPNVSVVCDRIEEFSTQHRFDVVTLVGVLEYARVYGEEGENAEALILSKIRKLLKPDGIIIIAIENKLGLKYFAGAREDHTGIPFHGINDNYGPRSVATFGREELGLLLNQIGIDHQRWYVPCPDYKLPVTVLAPKILGGYPELASSLLAQAAWFDPQRPADPTFSIEKAWPVLYENGLIADLANSFLLVASADARAISSIETDPSLAWHFSLDRHPAFVKETRFFGVQSRVGVEKSRLTAVEDPPVPLQLDAEKSIYKVGENWWTQLVAIVNSPGWTSRQVAAWAKVWVDHLARESGVGKFNAETFRSPIDGRHFDATPFNMIRDASGRAHFFDQEWVVGPNLELGFVVFRGLKASLVRMTSCAEAGPGVSMIVNQLVVAIVAELGVLMTKFDIDRFSLTDMQIQAWVQGRGEIMSAEAAIAQSWAQTLRVRVSVERQGWADTSERLHREIAAVLGEIGTLRMAAAAQEEHRQAIDAALLAKSDQMEALRAAAEAERSEAEAALQQKAAEVANLSSALQERTLALDSLAPVLEQTRAVAAAQEQKAAEYLAKFEESEQRAGSLAQERDAAANLLGEAQAELQRLQNAQAELQSLRDDAQANLQRLRDESEAEVQQLRSETEQIRAAALLETGELNKELEATREWLRDAQAQLQRLGGEAELARKNWEAERSAGLLRQQEVERLSLKAEAHQAEILQLQRRQTEGSQARERLQVEISALEQELIASVEERGTSLRQMERIGLELAQREQLIAELAQNADRQRLDHIREVERLNLESSQLEALYMARFAEASHARTTLEDQLRGMKAELDERSAMLAEQSRRATNDVKALHAGAEELRRTILAQAEIIAASQRPGAVQAFVARLKDRLAKRTGRGGRQWEADVIRTSRLFSPVWYLTANPDVAASGADPLEHYLSFGDAEGRNPHPLFDVSWYRTQNPDVARAKMSALAHYVTVGVSGGLDPSPLFDTDFYLRNNPEVAASGINPLFHYVNSGAVEGRDPHPLFDSSWYLEQNQDIARVRDNPLEHFMTHGWKEKRDPHQLFDVGWYLERYPDVAKSGTNPLLHFLKYGGKEGRDPHPLFASAWYLEHHPDAAESGVNPLLHYVLHTRS